MQTIQVKHLHIIFQGQSAPGALQNVSISYNTKCMLLVTDDEWMSYPNSRFHVFAYSYFRHVKKKKKKKGKPIRHTLASRVLIHNNTVSNLREKSG